MKLFFQKIVISDRMSKSKGKKTDVWLASRKEMTLPRKIVNSNEYPKTKSKTQTDHTFPNLEKQKRGPQNVTLKHVNISLVTEENKSTCGIQASQITISLSSIAKANLALSKQDSRLFPPNGN